MIFHNAKGKAFAYLRIATLAAALTGATSPALALQRDFPTGEPGIHVTYVDEGGPGHATACVIVISAGLPELALSISLFSSNVFTVTIASQRPLPKVVPNSDATVRINSVYIFSKVTSAARQGKFNVVIFAPVKNTPMQIVFDALNQLTFKPTRVDIVADDVQFPNVNLVPGQRLADTVIDCQRYMIAQ